MIADIGTRRCSSIKDVDPDSLWINGHEWMKEDESNFPMMSVGDISLTSKQTEEMTIELQRSTTETYYSTKDDAAYDKIRARYQFSQYLIDPNRHRFPVVIRITALILKFIKNVRYHVSTRKTGQDVAPRNKEEILDYIFLSDDDFNLVETCECLPYLTCPWAKMTMKIFVQRIFTIFATNASFCA